MKNKFGFYSFILTSAVCLCTVPAFAASSVRTLGTGNGTVVGTSGAAGVKTVAPNIVARPGVSTSSVKSTNRASSLRFQPSVSSMNTNAAKPTNTGVSTSVSLSPSSRLSIGKYLNLSHSQVTPTGSTGTGGSSSGGSTTDWSSQIAELRRRIEEFNNSKQNTLIVGSDEYIEITGDDNNVISIKMGDLKAEILEALGTQREIVFGLDSGDKLWWCYADELAANNHTVCNVGTGGKLVVNLSDVLSRYDTSNIQPIRDDVASLRTALAGKQGLLTPAQDGYITLNQETGVIGFDYSRLQEVLGIDNLARETEIVYQDGVLKWRYTDEFTTDPDTGERIKAWQTPALDVRTLLANTQIKLGEAENGFITLTPNGNTETIDIKYEALRDALGIDGATEIKVEGDVLKWRYLNEFDNEGHKVYPHQKDLSSFLTAADLTNYVTTESMADAITDAINDALAGLSIPSMPGDTGLYILGVDEQGPGWQPIEIVDADDSGL